VSKKAEIAGAFRAAALRHLPQRYAVPVRYLVPVAADEISAASNRNDPWSAKRSTLGEIYRPLNPKTGER
jgi:hypothetical protein